METKFKDVRNLLSRIDRISICRYRDLSYRNYENIASVPSDIDVLFVYGIGIIDSECGEDSETKFARHLEIVVDEKPQNEYRKLENICESGSIFYLEKEKGREFYQLVNIMDDRACLIKLSTMHDIENDFQCIPGEMIDPDDFDTVYTFLGHLFEHVDLSLSEESDRFRLIDKNGPVYHLYEGPVISKVRVKAGKDL